MLRTGKNPQGIPVGAVSDLTVGEIRQSNAVEIGQPNVGRQTSTTTVTT